MWKGMHKQIKQYIINCPKCQIKKNSKLTIMPLTLKDTSNKQLKVYMDIVGIKPETTSGNKYILTFQDDLSNFMTCVAIPDAEATQ